MVDSHSVAPSPRARARWLLAGALAALLIAAGVATVLTQANSAPAGALPSNGRIVYLPDPGKPGADPASMRGLGVQVATSVADLIAAVATADAVMVDRSALRQLPPGFLATQYTASKVVLGVNTPSDELEDIVGFVPTFPLAPLRQDWGGSAYYSYIYRTPPTPARQGFGRESDGFASPGLLVGRVQRAIADARATPPLPTR